MLSYLPPILQYCLAALAFTAAVYDLRFRRVPNWVVLAGLIVGFGLNSFLYEGPGAWLALKGFAIAALIYMPLYLVRGMGAGDVKLMMAIGCIVGPGNWLGILLLTALIGGVVGLFAVAVNGRLGLTYRNLGQIAFGLAHRTAPYRLNPELDVRSERGSRLPHAVFIALATLAYLVAAQIWAPR